MRSTHRLYIAGFFALFTTACSSSSAGVPAVSMIAPAPTPPSSSTTDNPSGLVPHKPMHWIISEAGVQILQTKMALSQITAVLDNSNTYEIMNVLSHPDPLPHAQHLLYYRDETLIAPDIAAGKFTGMAGALYDDEAYNEPGNTTPADQKANPLPYAQDAASVLHNAGLLFVYTIGQSTGPTGQFLTTTLPSVSPYPDVIDFQTQSSEGTPYYAREIASYSNIFRAHGQGLMLAGIGAAPQGKTETATTVISAFNAGASNVPPVDGFWINLVPHNPSCTGCPPVVDPTPIVTLLRLL